jgi:hypothetical protein
VTVLGALWAFRDVTGMFADSLREELDDVRSLMPQLDDLRLENPV